MVRLKACHCEPLAVTMVKYQVWPNTPVCPSFAMDLELMHWMRALMLECQLSVKKFFYALKQKTSVGIFGLGLKVSTL